MSEIETSSYWNLAQALRLAVNSHDPAAIAEAVDDLEVMAMHGSPYVAAQARRLAETAQRVPDL